MKKTMCAVIGALALLGAAAFAAPASGGDLSPSANADGSGAAASTMAVGSPPQPGYWGANPRISERDGSYGWQGGLLYAAWTANSVQRPGHYNAWLVEDDSGSGGRVNVRGTEGAVGGFSGNWMVFTQWRPGQPGDLFRAGPDRYPIRRFPAKVNTPAREFLPTMSGRWLLFTRFTAATDTYRVMLYNRQTSGIHTLARASGAGAVFAGQVNGDYATWFSWGPEQSNVFRYRISSQNTVRIPKPPQFARQHHPAVAADGTLYYQRRVGRACGSSPELMRYPVGGPPEVLWAYPDGQDGGRLVLDSVGADGALNITVVGCSLPSFRSTDVYRMGGIDR